MSGSQTGGRGVKEIQTVRDSLTGARVFCAQKEKLWKRIQRVKKCLSYWFLQLAQYIFLLFKRIHFYCSKLADSRLILGDVMRLEHLAEKKKSAYWGEGASKQETLWGNNSKNTRRVRVDFYVQFSSTDKLLLHNLCRCTGVRKCFILRWQNSNLTETFTLGLYFHDRSIMTHRSAQRDYTQSNVSLTLWLKLWLTLYI